MAIAAGLIGLKLLAPSDAATPVTSSGQAALARALQNVSTARVYSYSARDSQGTTMDTAKIIDNPEGGYLAVYHGAKKIKLATSSNLKTWTFRRNLGPGTQPTIAATSDGGFLVALEANNGGGFVRLGHYASLADLYAGRADKVFSAGRKLSKCNEGTPNIISASLNPDVSHSVIKVGFHYHNNCNTDRQAVATLTNFSKWSPSKAPILDKAIAAAAKANGKSIGGNIGDRDFMRFGSTNYGIFEAQYSKNKFATWRPYLYNFSTGKAQLLNIKTHRGSKAFANPTMTAAKGPDGRKGIIVTFFVPGAPGEGAAPGEGGTLIYFVPTSKASNIL